ncbi:hypothetical protein DAPPUDRAFT_342230 [Daphnia pulex]|uniref:Major facilitator superfamily (MFS) profile domain-containing protein n=1 Tax=Daphnia pulex TaxID=6669 RepID=E9I5U0_DAPPU|nr:hypothetical protein DAPPUDRAFT_342230 [Daphnia pulex]|eukprot:EFX60640.1 hypothetical protein DAPPUDRAFT_342230 [Daphnia pulex]
MCPQGGDVAVSRNKKRLTKNFAMPRTPVSPILILYRGIFALGGAATSSMLTAVLAGYSSEKVPRCFELLTSYHLCLLISCLLIGLHWRLFSPRRHHYHHDFLPLWVYKYNVENNLCLSKSVDSPTIKTDCHDAYIKASILSGITQTAVMFAAPVFGWLGDRLYRPYAVLLAAILGLGSYLLLYTCRDPTAKILYLVAVLVGVGEMGIVVSSLSVVTSKAIPAAVRGSVSGMYSLCGTIGIMLASKLGGYLFDTWTSTAPFFIMAMGNVLAIVACALVIVQDARLAKAQGVSLREFELHQAELPLC